MKIAVYPGSFDPVTKGHLNIITRASRLFDEVIVCVMVNSEKQPMFSLQERRSQLARVTAGLPNVRVDAHDGLLAEYAAAHGCCTIIKGLRAGSDFEKEFQIKEMGYYDADLTGLLPEEIIPEFRERILQRRKYKEEVR